MTARGRTARGPSPWRDPSGEVLDTRANTRSTGPKSRQYGIIAALVGRTPTVGAEVDIERHLVGRQCLVSIETNDNDYPYIKTFMALPPARVGNGSAPAPTPTPVPPAVVPEPVPAVTPAAAPASGELPF